MREIFLLLTCMLTVALSIALLALLLIICLAKCKKVRDLRRKPKVDIKVDINDTYGTYDVTGEISDYTTVEDANDYYGQ